MGPVKPLADARSADDVAVVMAVAVASIHRFDDEGDEDVEDDDKDDDNDDTNDDREEDDGTVDAGAAAGPSGILLPRSDEKGPKAMAAAGGIKNAGFRGRLGDGAKPWAPSKPPQDESIPRWKSAARSPPPPPPPQGWCWKY
jgi:hypothetical protein